MHGMEARLTRQNRYQSITWDSKTLSRLSQHLRISRHPSRYLRRSTGIGRVHLPCLREPFPTHSPTTRVPEHKNDTPEDTSAFCLSGRFREDFPSRSLFSVVHDLCGVIEFENELSLSGNNAARTIPLFAFFTIVLVAWHGDGAGVYHICMRLRLRCQASSCSLINGIDVMALQRRSTIRRHLCLRPR